MAVSSAEAAMVNGAAVFKVSFCVTFRSPGDGELLSASVFASDSLLMDSGELMARGGAVVGWSASIVMAF